MKLKLLTPILCCMTALSLSALADDGQGDNNQGDDNGGNCGGNQSTNSASEEFEATIALVATTNAPSGATGTARLKEESEDGSVESSLKVVVQGLSAGDYTLSAVKISDGSSEQLAQFTVSSFSGGDEDDNGDDGEEGFHGWFGGGWQGWTNNWQGWTNNCQGGETNTNTVLFGFVRTSLPSDLDATNIAQLVVADTNGVSMLVGDLQNPTNSTTVSLKETVSVVGGSASPNATGTAVFQRLISHRHVIEHYTMSASGVPARSSFAVHVNGKPVSQVKSTSRGKVSVKKLPGKQRLAPSVTLVDKHGESVAAANF